MGERIVQALIVLIGVPAVLVGYVAVVEWLLRFVPERSRPRARPWLWLGPAFFFLLVFLVYPALNTMYLSLRNRDGSEFVGLQNYVYAFTNRDMLFALRNNLLWVIFFPLFAVTLGLLLAVLTDRVR
ncbi:MAG: ABC transporter, partial [Chloroflexi bacterium]